MKDEPLPERAMFPGVFPSLVLMYVMFLGERTACPGGMFTDIWQK